MHRDPFDDRSLDDGPWYRDITRYQWTVLFIASLGWVFDVFEGQIFVSSMNEAMPALLPGEASRGEITYYNNIAFAAFLVGGALGGMIFGALSDRIGRKRAMIWTILAYSLFTSISALSQTWWQLVILRFFVALGVGGEWAVASALVAEVFPARARAWSLGIFHATSVLGTFLAILAGLFVVGNPALGPNAWRLAFLLGALPAALTIWVRLSLREPERWQQAVREETAEQRSSWLVGQLFGARWLRQTVIGVLLAAVGLATFWGVHVYAKDRLRDVAWKRLQSEVAQETEAGAAEPGSAVWSGEQLAYRKRWEMLGLFLVTAGGGIGLVCFGPLSERLGRRGAFLAYCVGGLLSSLVVYQVLDDVASLVVFLPVFGFLTLGMHAGYAIYFPELFPTRLRSTGAGFCFNVGRMVAAPALLLAGWMQKDWGYSLEDASTLLSLLFLVGIGLVLVAPETKGRELPE